MTLRANQEAIFRDYQWGLNQTGSDDREWLTDYEKQSEALSEKERAKIRRIYSGDEERLYLEIEQVNGEHRKEKLDRSLQLDGRQREFKRIVEMKKALEDKLAKSILTLIGESKAEEARLLENLL